MSKLREGVWMAQGPSQNVIIKAVGTAPFIEIVSAISMNCFYETGEVKKLTSKSPEIRDILQNPDKYSFEALTVTDAVHNLIGIETLSNKIINNSITDEDIKDLARKYRKHLERFGPELDHKFIMDLCINYKLDVSQANNLLENKIKRILDYV